MVNTAVEKRVGDFTDPRIEKAMSLIEAERARKNDFGAGSEGITTEAVLGNFEDSMKLLCASLQNQDPTNPMDIKDISQQFSIVAQTQASVEMKQILQKMANSNEVSKMLDAAKQLDSLVKIKGDTFTYSPNEQVELGFYAPPETAKASYIITDINNRVVRIVNGEVDESPDGYHGFVWDGKDNDGNAVTPGKYKFRVSLVDKNEDILRDQKGEPLIAKTTVFGRVHGSDLKGGKPRFAIAGQHYNMDGLISVQSSEYYKEKLGLVQEMMAEKEGMKSALKELDKENVGNNQDWIGEEDLHL